jgi:predicted RNase H-like HicB family nuclease
MSEPGPTSDLSPVVTREGEWYVARSREIEAVSQGETIEQALANLREVVEIYLEDWENCLEFGHTKAFSIMRGCRPAHP